MTENIFSNTSHEAKVFYEAAQLVGKALSGETEAVRKELIKMSAQEQKEVLLAAQKYEKSREYGHGSDPNFPRVEFYDSASLNGGPAEPTISVTGYGQTAEVYDPLNPQLVGKAFYDSKQSYTSDGRSVVAAAKPVPAGQTIFDIERLYSIDI